MSPESTKLHLLVFPSGNIINWTLMTFRSLKIYEENCQLVVLHKYKVVRMRAAFVLGSNLTSAEVGISRKRENRGPAGRKH